MPTLVRAGSIAMIVVAAALGSSGVAVADDSPPGGIVTCTPSAAAYAESPGSDAIAVRAAGDSSLLCRIFHVDVTVVDVTSGQSLYRGTMGATAAFEATFTLPRGHTLTVTAGQHYSTVQDSATAVAVAPGPVTSLVASEATPTSVRLDWGPVTSDGGSPVTGYAVAWPGGTIPTPATEVVITGLTPATSYTFAVTAVNSAGSSTATTVVASTPVRPTPPGPSPSPQPAPITPPSQPTTGTGNIDGSFDTDSAARTIQQTMPGTWPKRSALVSGKRMALGRLADLRTNAGQQAVLSVTYLSPSVRSAVVSIDGRGRVVAVTATLKAGARSGAVVVTVSAAPVNAGGVGYEGIQASRRFTVRPR
jgi:hypothetical protein